MNISSSRFSMFIYTNNYWYSVYRWAPFSPPVSSFFPPVDFLKKNIYAHICVRVDVERAGRMKIWGFISDRPIGFFHLSHGRRRRAHLVENSVKVKPDGSTGGHEPQTKSFSVDPRNQNQCYHVSCGGFCFGLWRNRSQIISEPRSRKLWTKRPFEKKCYQIPNRDVVLASTVSPRTSTPSEIPRERTSERERERDEPKQKWKIRKNKRKK